MICISSHHIFNVFTVLHAMFFRMHCLKGRCIKKNTYKRKENNMKEIKKIPAFRRIFGALLILTITVATFTACSSDDDNNYVICPKVKNFGIVTVKHSADSIVYLQLDDSTTLYPQNIKNSIFGGKEVRAFVDFSVMKENNSQYTYSVIVNGIDSVLTKPTAATLGTDNDKVYGNDPVEVMTGFPTVCEDNYLTLYIATNFGNIGKRHLVNLVTGTNADDPYEVEMRHNAYGDTNGKTAYATVAFSLKNLPKTGGKTVKLKLKYQSFSGEKTVQFDYKTTE